MSDPILGIDDLKLGYVKPYVFSAALASGATSGTLVSGGSDFAAASVSNPIELTVVTNGVGEKLLVTARSSNDLTFTRAAFGTTAVAHATGDTVQAIHEVDIGMAQDLTLDPNINTIEYNGDGTVVRVPISQGVSGSMAMEFWTKEFLELIAGVTRHTSNLPSDETARSYPQLGNYPYTRIRAKIRVIETRRVVLLDTGESRFPRQLFSVQQRSARLRLVKRRRLNLPLRRFRHAPTLRVLCCRISARPMQLRL
jgi:hypothetical protein